MKIPAALLTLAALSIGASAAAPKGITSQPFGKTADGAPVEIYTLRNASGMEARITTYGGAVVSLKVPDRAGKLADVVLGYDKLENYIATSPYFGALVGRYANRIADGKFTVDGQEYQLALNSGPNSLHGGLKGFDKKVWTAKPAATNDGPSLQLTYVSKDGEEEFPGTLSVTAVYTLTGKNELRLDFTATTDKPTIVNLTNHSYFNLAGQGEGDILGHEVTINADKFVVVNAMRIPTGELRSVGGTPLDFRKQTVIGARINDDDEQVKFAKGYDHCWVINKKPGELALMARVVEPKSGRVLEVLSTEPGLQFYTGNGIKDSDAGKGGKSYHARYAFCMEPGHFPDSPNHADFPSVVLRPGETYSNTIIYRFSTEKKSQ